LLGKLTQFDAAIPGVRFTDTIKRIDGEEVLSTFFRDLLIGVHTPQVFRAQVLQQAYAKAAKDGFLGTDDASLVDRLPEARIVWIEDDPNNLKVTMPRDLERAEYLIREQHYADWFRI